jgi:glycosyltransferase involved in cell wall biosynthesis
VRAAIVIPAYNEAATIERVVAELLPFGTPIVVDDCSDDDTALLASRAGAQVVRHTKNGGYEAALQSGFEAADRLGMEAVVTFDADGQHQAETVARVLELLQDGNALVLGCRSQSARFSEALFSLYTRLRHGVSDILCGLKGYRIGLFQDYGHFDYTRSVGTELALWALRQRVPHAFVPVTVRPRQEGEARFGGALRANWRILRAMAAAVGADLQALVVSGAASSQPTVSVRERGR